MKFSLALIFIFGIFSANNSEIKIKVLQSVFTQSKLLEYKGEKILETKARGKFATIPIDDNSCRLLKFENNIVALAFNIYLSDNENDYRKMKDAGLYNFMDVEEGSDLETLTKNERFIQLIFYDIKKNKFLGKAEGFPIEGLDWLPTGMGDVTTIIEIDNLKPINKNKYSGYLSLTECPDCTNSTYCFKYSDGKVLVSKKYTGCYESIIESGRKIMGKEITNCYENTYDNEQAKYEIVTLLKW